MSYFIGWNDQMPARNKKALRKLLIPVFIGIPVLTFCLVFFSKPFNDHQFELGNVKSFTGTYYADPFPVILLEEGQVPEGYDPAALLVGYGKNGAKGFMESIEKERGGLTGKQVELHGTLIYGDGKVLIELTKKEASLGKIISNNIQLTQPIGNTEQQLSGEILDPKCWFGVMKPAEGKVHKSCAIRCISGGISPVFRVQSDSGNKYYVLKGKTGEDINQMVLSYVGEPVQIQGKSYRQNGWQVLEVGEISL
ncbi:MAG: hypothetical protein Sapg2KO_51000 [Saprospiraceae bacterium]